MELLSVLWKKRKRPLHPAHGLVSQHAILFLHLYLPYFFPLSLFLIPPFPPPFFPSPLPPSLPPFFLPSFPSGLRKVTNEMKTHKNPELRASSVVKASEVKKPTQAAPKFGAPTAKKSPVCELQGKKWVVVSLSVCLSVCLLSVKYSYIQ